MDRPALETEIEITPEMIEAGVLALSRYDPEDELIEDAAARIYRAICRVAPRCAPPGRS